MATGAASDWGEELDTYDVEGSLPGQPWTAYKAKKTRTEKGTDKNFAMTLTKMLKPTVTVEELEKKFQWFYDSPHETRPRPWIRFRQKKCDTASWLAGGIVHPGAHFPLLVFTYNAESNRTGEAKQGRTHRNNERRVAQGKKPWSGKRQCGQQWRPASVEWRSAGAASSVEWKPPPCRASARVSWADERDDLQASGNWHEQGDWQEKGKWQEQDNRQEKYKWQDYQNQWW